MKALKARVLMVAAAMFVVACQTGSFIHDIDINPTGTYSLRLINTSQTLPYTTGAGNQAVTLSSQTLSLADDGSWSETTIRTSVKNGATVTDTLSDGGTYTFVKDGSSITLHSTLSNSTVYTGSFATESLALNGTDGNVYYFAV